MQIAAWASAAKANIRGAAHSLALLQTAKRAKLMAMVLWI